MELSELVPAPAGGRVFEGHVRAGLADTTPSGRARLDAIARWLQDVAHSDVEDAGLEAERAAWVLRRMRLRVERFPRFGEHVTLRTWCSGLGRLAAERRTTIAGGDGVACVEGVAIWIHVDPGSALPARITGPFRELYAKSAGGRGAKGRLRHPDPPTGARRRDWRFRASDLDLAGHVNNACYWEPVEEGLAEAPEPQGLDADIEFRSPALAGDAVVLREGDATWVASPDGELHASILGA